MLRKTIRGRKFPWDFRFCTADDVGHNEYASIYVSVVPWGCSNCPHPCIRFGKQTINKRSSVFSTGSVICRTRRCRRGQSLSCLPFRVQFIHLQMTWANCNKCIPLTEGDCWSIKQTNNENVLLPDFRFNRFNGFTQSRVIIKWNCNEDIILRVYREVVLK